MEQITTEQFRQLQAGQGYLEGTITVRRPDGSIRYQGPLLLTPEKVEFTEEKTS